MRSTIIQPEIIEQILRTGGQTNFSVERILFNASITDMTVEEFSDFLKQEYGNGNKGLILNGSKYSVKYSETGVKIGQGETTDCLMVDQLSWLETAACIMDMVKAGTFSSMSLSAAEKAVFKRVNAQIQFTIEDVQYNLVEDNYSVLEGSFVERTRRIYDLSNLATLSQLIDEFSRLNEECKKNPKIMRYKFHTPYEILQSLKKIIRPRSAYVVSTAYQSIPVKSFISKDMIDQSIRDENPRTKLKLYEYICSYGKEGLADKAKVIFGTGGRSSTCLGEDSEISYDANGMKLSLGYFKSDENEKDNVLISWNKYADRLYYLTEMNKYLTNDDLAEMGNYKLDQISRRVTCFYHDLPYELRNYPVDYYVVKKKVLIAVKKRGITGIYQQMSEDYDRFLAEGYEKKVKENVLNSLRENLQFINSCVQGEYDPFLKKKTEDKNINGQEDTSIKVDEGSMNTESNIVSTVMQEKSSQRKSKKKSLSGKQMSIFDLFEFA